MDLPRKLIECMRDSGVEFQYVDYQSGEMGGVGYPKTTILGNMAWYNPHIEYTPIGQIANWEAIGMAKLSGRKIIMTDRCGDTGEMAQGDYDFTYGLEYEIGDFSFTAPTEYFANHPLLVDVVRRMVESRVEFFAAGLVLSRDDFSHIHTVELVKWEPLGQVENWASLGLACLCGAEIEIRTSGGADLGRVKLTERNFRFSENYTFNIITSDAPVEIPTPLEEHPEVARLQEEIQAIKLLISLGYTVGKCIS